MPELKILTQDEIIKRIHKGEKNFSNIRLVGANLEGQKLDGAIFRNCEFIFVRFAYASLVGADFTGSIIEGGGFSTANLTRANFQHTKMHYTYFGNAIFDKTDFRFSEINFSYFGETQLGGADFTNARISRMITSWSEVTEDEFNTILRTFLDTANRLNIPRARILQMKSFLESVKGSAGERLKLTYDMMNKGGFGGVYQPKEIGEFRPDKYSPQTGKVYTSKLEEYGEREKGKKSGLEYKKS